MNLEQYFHHYAQLIHKLQHYLGELIYQEDLDQLMLLDMQLFETAQHDIQQLITCSHEKLAYIEKPHQHGGGAAIRQQCQHCGFITSYAVAKAKIPTNTQLRGYDEAQFERYSQLSSISRVIEFVLNHWGNQNLQTRCQHIKHGSLSNRISYQERKLQLNTIMQQLTDYLKQEGRTDAAEHLNSVLTDVLSDTSAVTQLQQHFLDIPAPQRTPELKAWFRENFDQVFFFKPDVEIYRYPVTSSDQIVRNNVLEGKIDFLVDFKPQIREKILAEYAAKQGNFPAELMDDLNKGPFAIQVKYFNGLDKSEGFSREYAETMAKLIRYRQGYCEVRRKNVQGQIEKSNHQVPVLMLVSNLSFATEREQLRQQLCFGSNFYDKAYYQDRVGHQFNIGHFIFEMNKQDMLQVQRWYMKFLNMTYVDCIVADDQQEQVYRRGRAKLLSRIG